MEAAPGEVARYLAAADVGLAFRSTGFSMQAVAPVKVSEYLLCGLPVAGTASVGDTKTAVAEGLFFPDDAGVGAAAEWVVRDVMPHREDFRTRARAVGVRSFSLQRSIDDYYRAIEPLVVQ
jgi:glycosyltransferase involved in cell wall biosynthesis